VPRIARDVVFVDGVRTPFGKAGPNGLYAETRADDMVVSVIRELLRRNADYVPAYLMFAQMLVKESRPDDARQILQQGISAASKAGNGHALSEMEALLSEL